MVNSTDFFTLSGRTPTVIVTSVSSTTQTFHFRPFRTIVGIFVNISAHLTPTVVPRQASGPLTADPSASASFQDLAPHPRQGVVMSGQAIAVPVAEASAQAPSDYFDFEVRYNFEADPAIMSMKIPLSELQKLMLNPNGAIQISHAEITSTLYALSADPKAPLQDRSVAIELLKRRS
jgi:hypothetical protein